MSNIVSTRDEWEKELNKKMLKVTIKKHQKINFVLNIICVLLCVFVLKLTVPQMLIALVVYDVIAMGLDYVCCNIVAKKKNENLTEKKLTSLIEKYQNMADNLQHDLDTKDYNHYERAEVRDELSELKDQLVILQKKLEDEKAKSVDNGSTKTVSAIENLNLSKVDQIKSLCKQLELAKHTKLTSEMVEAGISLDAIIAGTNVVLELIDEKPEAIDYAYSSYCIFAKELINIFDSLNKKSIEDKQSYFSQTQSIIEEMEKYIFNIEYKIRHSDKVDICTSMNVLLDRLKENNEASEAGKYDTTQEEGYKEYDGLLGDDLSDTVPELDK